MVIHISSGTIIRSVLFLLLVVALFYLRDLALVVLTAVVIASAIEPGVAWFTKHRIPRVFAVLLIYLLTALFLFGLFYVFVPPVLDEMARFLTSLPRYLDTIEFSNPLSTGALLGQSATTDFSLRDIVFQLQTALSSVSEGFLRTVSSVFGGVFSFILIIVFSFYFAVQETGVDDFLRIVTPTKHQQKVLALWKRSQLKIGRWLQGQLMLGLVVGVIVYLGLTILGVRFALLFAIIAALFELIPLFGPILAAIPAVAISFVDGGLGLGLLVIGMYVIIQQFENHLIYPLVVSKVVGVPPLLVILALIVGAQLAGFLGIILSVPVAAVIRELVSDIERERGIRSSVSL